MEPLLAEAARLGIAVKYASLDQPLRGAYLPEHSLIIIDKALTLPQRRETLAHELGHAHYGHDCTTPTTEAQAWRRAAHLTVNPDAYARAERLNPHPAAIALELDLTPTLILEWQKHYAHGYLRTTA